jgi:dihydrofolate reductase
MRKVIVAEHISLDGVVQAPGGPEEDASGGFRFGGWVAPFDDPVVDAFLEELFARPFDLLLGRGTYDIFAAYWPAIPAGHPVGDPFNQAIKHVATHRPESLAWPDSVALAGGLAESVRALKAESGPDLMTWGSPGLVRQLLAARLVDELWLLTYPVVLGAGKRLFGPEALPSALTLEHSAVGPTGAIATRHTWAGDVRTGSVVA